MQSDVVSKIRNGDETGVMALYAEYKEEFVQWSTFKFKLDQQIALDVFQDSVISFYTNVKKGKITKINHTVKTYLFAIAKNLILNKLKYEERFDREFDDFNTLSIPQDFDKKIEMTERHNVILALLQKMGEPCHTLLKLFFFERFSTEAIAEKLAYKNTNVVKSQKLRCINQLRNSVTKNYKIEDL